MNTKETLTTYNISETAERLRTLRELKKIKQSDAAELVMPCTIFAGVFQPKAGRHV